MLNMNSKKLAALILSASISVSLLPGLVLNVAASETPSFIENFDSYTSTDGTVTSAKQFTGEPEVIAVHPSGAKWITSAKKHGNFLNGLYWGHSYIDVSSDTLYVRGHGRFPVAVNLEFNEATEIIRYEKFELVTGRGVYPENREAVGVALFTSEDELSCLELKQDIMTGIPSVAKHVNTAPGVYSLGTVLGTGTTDDGWSTADTNVTWTVEISEDNVLTVTATGSSLGRSVWTIDDSDVKSMMTNCKYPVSALNRTEGYGNSFKLLHSVKMWYKEVPKLYYMDLETNRYVYLADSEIELKQGDTLSLRILESSQICEGVTWKSGSERLLSVDEYGNITAKKSGETTVTATYDGNEYNCNVKIKGVLDEIIEEGDVGKMADHLIGQNALLQAFSDAITTGNTGEIQRFISDCQSPAKDTLYFMDRINYGDFEHLTKAENSQELSDFVQRLASYSNYEGILPYSCVLDTQTRDELVTKITTLKEEGNFEKAFEEIDEFGEMLVREMKIQSLNGISDGAQLKSIVVENNDVFGLGLEDKYYVEYADKIYEYLAKNTTAFENYYDMTEKFVCAIIFVNINNTMSSDYLCEILEAYQSKIGYDKAYYESIEKDDEFSQALVAASLDNLAALVQFINTYTPSVPAATPTPVPTKRPIVSTGGGGGGGGGGVKAPTVPAPVQQAENENEPVAAPQQIFSDVPTDFWGYEAIRYLKAKSAADGYEDGSFRPDDFVKRAEYIKMLLEVFGADTEIGEDYQNPFADLEETDWYYETMAKANILGIMNGNGAMCYPQRTITRQEAVALIYRMVENQGQTLNRNTVIEKFGDEKQIEEWAVAPVLEMQAAGIINGIGGYFMPYSETTRAQSAQMLYKVVHSFENEEVSE